MPSPAVILTIAGSDSCAGAGLQADLKTIACLGGYGICAVTAVVSEVPGKVSRVQAMEPEMLADQLRILAEHYPLAAIKTGMLANTELAEVTAGFLETFAKPKKIPLVVDPVMVATSGDRLLDDNAIEVYRSRILPLATLATPNLGEASVLLDRPVTLLEQMEDAAREFHRLYGCATLIKGGHLKDSDKAVDVCFRPGHVSRLNAPFYPDIDTHGTGCTLSAALATFLGMGYTLSDALGHSKMFITKAIEQSFRWSAPATIYALNHFPEEPDLPE